LAETRRAAKKDSQNSVRLNRAIAASGLCSRRKADQLIAEGKVKINGQLVTDFSQCVNLEKDVVAVAGKTLFSRKLEYVMLHKPKGIITSCEDEKRRLAVINLLPKSLRHLKPIGRLDYDSEGLLLMTNDGPLIYALTHPSKEVFKTYEVLVEGSVNSSILENLAQGTKLADGLTQPAKVKVLGQEGKLSRFKISIREGKNRQLRRMCSHFGLKVVRLIRVAVGELQLSELKPGSWRYLSLDEIRHLCLAKTKVKP
jgi:23S rRNA pseudouridine2605 synthase